MHLNGNVLDSTGSTSPVNGGATPTTSVVGGLAMNLAAGDITASNITNFPIGDKPTSSGQVWVRARKLNNWSMPLAWGNKNSYGWNTWQMQIGFWNSPVVLPAPLTCRGPVALTSATALAAEQWYHLAYTNSGGTAKLYVNGVLDGTTTTTNSLNITSPQGMSLGMATGNADVDEARVSSVARSADWVKLEYENQKPAQTLVGGIVPAGSDFSVSPASVTMTENSTSMLTAQAGGAQKVYWLYVKNGQETVLAVDQLAYNYTVGRITGSDSAVIRFKAVFAGGTQSIDVPLTVTDTIPDPVFTLTPSTTTWNGRDTMTVTANITNLAAMQSAGFGTLNY
jgi:Concanavalin A-like lectin/glucanases superfamily